MRIVLLTNGTTPVAQGFSDFPGTPVGIIDWNSPPSSEPEWMYSVRKLVAFLRRRPYGSLRHLCEKQGLRFANILRREPSVLKTVLKDWQADLVITSCCPLLPVSDLEDVPYGGINLHPSLLPAYRGSEPLFWQVYDCVEETGCTVHVLSAGTDKGGILGQRSIKCPSGLDKASLTQVTEGDIGVPLLKQVVTELMEGTSQDQSQPEVSTTKYAGSFKVPDLNKVIQVDELSIQSLWNTVRFFGYCPSALCEFTGWRRWFKWKPVTMTVRSPVSAKEPRGLTSRVTGLRLLLEVSDGSVVLIPRFSLKHVMATLLEPKNLQT